MGNQLKVLIADDEENIRAGLQCVLDWESLGCKICGEASSGKDALEKISYLQPDIVLLDVKMPGMTGLEVMKSLSEKIKEDPELKMPNIIILSGFSDFEYAKTALNYGAKAYLSKPVDEDELQKVVLSVKAEIEKAQNLLESTKSSESLNLKYYLLNLFQTYKIEPLSYLETSSFFQNVDESDYITLVFSKKYFSEENKDLIVATIKESFSFFNRVYIDFPDYVTVVFKTSNNDAVINCVQRIFQRYPQRTFITKSDMFKGVDGILESYKQAIKFLDYLYYYSDICCITSKVEKEENDAYTKEELSVDIENLIFCVETYSKVKFEELAKEMYIKMKDIRRPQSESKQDIIYCLLEIRNKISTKYPERDISEGQTFDIVPKVLEKITYDETFIYMKHVINSMIENFNLNTTDAVIIKVISYIKNNYTNDLKLENLGEMFNCNSAYLGKKFKKYTGVQFNSYLDELRIEDAKEKIRTSDLKIYQISKLVGFANTDYFFMKFKKYTGYTPKEYKIITEMENHNDKKVISKSEMEEEE